MSFYILCSKKLLVNLYRLSLILVGLVPNYNKNIIGSTRIR